MTEEDKPTPPPSIQSTPPEKPPVTTVDAETSDQKETPKETTEAETSSPPPVPGGVETDLMKRFLGVFIDAIVIIVIANIIGLIIKSFFFNLIISAVLWLVRDSLPFLNGQSIGKKAMKIKAVKEDGSSLSGDWSTGAMRNILFVVPFGLGGLVEGIIILTRNGSPQAGQRLGDDWAKTKVISVD